MSGGGGEKFMAVVVGTDVKARGERGAKNTKEAHDESTEPLRAIGDEHDPKVLAEGQKN